MAEIKCAVTGPQIQSMKTGKNKDMHSGRPYPKKINSFPRHSKESYILLEEC